MISDSPFKRLGYIGVQGLQGAERWTALAKAKQKHTASEPTRIWINTLRDMNVSILSIKPLELQYGI